MTRSKTPTAPASLTTHEVTVPAAPRATDSEGACCSAGPTTGCCSPGARAVPVAACCATAPTFCCA